MSQFGDNNARYYDGALGGWAGINSANPVAPFNRYIKGYIQGKTDAAAIIAGLQKNADGKITETIKIVSHSMGGIYSKGFVSALPVNFGKLVMQLGLGVQTMLGL